MPIYVCFEIGNFKPQKIFNCRLSFLVRGSSVLHFVINYISTPSLGRGNFLSNFFRNLTASQKKKVCVSLNENGAKITDKFTLQFRTWTRFDFLSRVPKETTTITDENEYAKAWGISTSYSIKKTSLYKVMFYFLHKNPWILRPIETIVSKFIAYPTLEYTKLVHF